MDEDGIPSYVTWGPLKGGQAYDFNSDAIILSDPHQAGSLSGRVRWDEQSITEEISATQAGVTLFLRDTGPWLMLLTALLVPVALVIATSRRS